MHRPLMAGPMCRHRCLGQSGWPTGSAAFVCLACFKREAILMSQALESDLKQIVLGGGPFGPREIKQIVGAIAEDFAQYRVLREAVSELELREDRSPAEAVRLGVCYFLLGRYSAAILTLKAGDGGALAHFYQA